MTAIYTGLGWIIYGITYAIGKLGSFLIVWLIEIASFNNFMGVDAVTEGWAIARNLANMFFILILLMIAFGIILRLENYSIKRSLPKLLVMAVLVNFSKAICGAIIEFSQVIMLTFVNAFSGIGSANLIHLLGVREMWESPSRSGGDLGLEVVAGLIVGLIATLIAIVVIVVAIAVLVMRVIMLWIYTILSPLAFLMSAFPQGQKYASMWWGKFTESVISGPVLAFFMWLAFLTAQSSAAAIGTKGVAAASGIEQGIMTQFLSAGVFQTYIITIGLLVGGLIVTQQVGGTAGSVAGKGMAAIQKGRSMATSQAKSSAKWAARGVGTGALGVAGYGLQKISTSPNSGINKVGQMASNWRTDLKSSLADSRKNSRLKTLKSMGMGEKTLASVKDVADSKMGRNFKAGVAGAATVGAVLASAPIAVPIAAAVAAAVAGFKSSRYSKQEKGKNTVDAAKKEKSSSVATANSGFESATEAQRNRRDARVAAAVNNRDNQLRVAQEQLNRGAMTAQGFNLAKNSINSTFSAKEKAAEDEFNNDPNVIAANNQKNNLINSADALYRQKIQGLDENSKITASHPNKVTMEAAKEGIKEITSAKKQVTNLAGDEKIVDYSKGTFYSPSGQTSAQKKFFDQLTSGSAEAMTAVANAAKTLADVEEKLKQGQKVPQAQLDAVLAFKQGAAAYKKNGGDLSNLRPVINIANNIKTGEGDEKHTRSVEDFESHVS
jgi:hypothetical protein